MTDPHLVTYTVKELLTRLDERMASLDQKLDLRLVAMEDRIIHIERAMAERQYLVAEHVELKRDVADLQTFHSRFLPVSVLVFLLLAVGFVWDFYFRVLT